VPGGVLERREPPFGKERSVGGMPIVRPYGDSENIGDIVIISFGILLHVARRWPLYEVLEFE